jgi:hypothetical protein
MRTVDRLHMRADPAAVFRAAADVERWPALLPHYRRVRMLEPLGTPLGTPPGTPPGTRPGGRGLVEMAAWRPFGPLRWPTWWVSEMWLDEAAPAVHYRHVRGITRGMDVVWRFEPRDGGTDVTIVHEWRGPAWPLVRRPAAEWVIGPVFVHGIASRTLAGIRKHVEAARR